MKPDQIPSFNVAKSLNEAVCVEVGTWEGDFSYELLRHTNCKKVYCVDPYKHFEDDSYPDGMNLLNQAQFDAKFATVNARFQPFGDRVEFLRMTSHEAAQRIANNSVDFVYIDGNHDYKAVLQDIQDWAPKVKPGGWLCGDDVYSTNLEDHDADGNVTRIWSHDCWGKYGTFKAIYDSGLKYVIDQTQFIVQIPLIQETEKKERFGRA